MLPWRGSEIQEPRDFKALTIASIANEKAWRRLSVLSRASGDLDDRVKIPAARVVVGEMLDFVNSERQPLTVMSYGELQDHASRHIPANVRAAWLSDKRAELRAAIRRKRYAETKGVPRNG